MTQPILYNISAFDKANEQVFKFNYSGNQAFKNRLIIRNNITNDIVYDQIQTTFKLQHELPPNTLTNGLTYNARISVFDSSNVESAYSHAILFNCFTTPQFVFDNIEEHQVVENSTYVVSLTYEQIEEEPLNEYQITLYNQNGLQIYTTGINYNTINLQATLSNLEDNRQYYVGASGKTLNGMYIETELIPFSTEYHSPATFSTVTLENQPFEGSIKISSNMFSILGTSNPDPPIFIDNNYVDLRESGSWVKFSENFTIKNDFTIQCVGKELLEYNEILELKNDKMRLSVKYMKSKVEGYGNEKVFLILRVYNSITNYELISNYIDVPLSNDWLSIWIRHIGGVYDIKLAVITT